MEGKGLVEGQVDVAKGLDARVSLQLNDEECFFGKLMDAEGSPLVGWPVGIADLEQPLLWAEGTVTDSNGDFVLGSLGLERSAVVEFRYNINGWGRVVHRVPMAAGLPSTLIQIPDRSIPTSSLRIQALRADGSSVKSVSVELVAEGDEYKESRFFNGSVVTFYPILDGPYTVIVKSSGCLPVSETTTLRRGELTRLNCTLYPAANIVCKLNLIELRAHGRVECILQGKGSLESEGINIRQNWGSGRVQFSNVPFGEYVVKEWIDGKIVVEKSVTISQETVVLGF